MPDVRDIACRRPWSRVTMWTYVFIDAFTPARLHAAGRYSVTIVYRRVVRSFPIDRTDRSIDLGSLAVGVSGMFNSGRMCADLLFTLRSVNRPQERIRLYRVSKDLSSRN